MDEERYRAAERALWHDAGATPTEHRVHLTRNQVDVRVLEVGSGPPTLFIHGGPGAAGTSWAHLATRLPQLRCLLLDRPGTGLSDPHPLGDPAAVRHEAETLVADVLDGLQIPRAHLVGSSHGSYVALLTAAVHPDRVERTVHLGCPGFVEGMQATAFDRLVLLPGAPQLFSRLPASERGLRSTLRQLGHTTALEAGRIPQPFIDWSVALQRHTTTMRNELVSTGNMGTFRRGFDASLTLDGETLGQVRSPTHLLWGDQDPYGDVSVAQELADALPDARLEMLPGAGSTTSATPPTRSATTCCPTSPPPPRETSTVVPRLSAIAVTLLVFRVSVDRAERQVSRWLRHHVGREPSHGRGC